MKTRLALFLTLVLLLTTNTILAQSRSSSIDIPTAPTHLPNEGDHNNQLIPPRDLTNEDMLKIVGEAGMPPRSESAVYGPDGFGYTMNDSASYSWIDARNVGTDLEISSSNTQAYYELPFSFNFYGLARNYILVGGGGYITAGSGHWAGDSYFGEVPSPRFPNGVIAPYNLSSFRQNMGSVSGGDNRVYARQGGSAPNRWVAIEWHKVQDWNGNPYTFQAVLYEGGDVKFQYQQISWANAPTNTSWNCQSTAIESPDGFDGVKYPYCMNPNVYSYSAILMQYPSPNRHIDMLPKHQGDFFTSESSRTFTISLYNRGTVNDRFNVTKTHGGAWNVNLFHADGVTPLSDTNGDGVKDSGVITPGASQNIVVAVQAPTALLPGANTIVELVASSASNSSVRDESEIDVVIPASFAKVYRDNADGGALTIETLNPLSNSQVQVSAADHYGYDVSVVELNNNRFFYAWSDYDSSKNDIEFSLVDNAGSVVLPITKLTNNSEDTYDYDPAVAVTPNGHVGVFWYRYEYDSSMGLSRRNLYSAILNQAGSVLSGPTQITSNGWTSSHPYYYDLRIAATDNNRFVYLWHVSTDNGSEAIQFQIRNAANGIVKSTTNLKADSSGSYNVNYSNPAITTVAGNKVLVAWRHYSYDPTTYSSSQSTNFRIINSSGSYGSGEKSSGIVANGYPNYQSSTIDAVQLMGGNILLAASHYTYGANLGDSKTHFIKYVLIDDAYNPSSVFTLNSRETTLGAGSASHQLSVTRDKFGHGIFTYHDDDGSYRSNLHYAMIDGSGAVVTPPRVVDTSSYIFSSAAGYGNTTFDSSTYYDTVDSALGQKVYLPIVIK